METKQINTYERTEPVQKVADRVSAFKSIARRATIGIMAVGMAAGAAGCATYQQTRAVENTLVGVAIGVAISRMDQQNHEYLRNHYRDGNQGYHPQNGQYNGNRGGHRNGHRRN